MPLYTSSGIEPDDLLLTPWLLRHAMASAPSRAAAYELLDVTVEQAAAGDPQVEQYGQIGWRSYVQRMWSWATTPPPDPPMTDDEMSALFGDPAEEDQA